MILDDIIFNKRQEVTALKVKFRGANFKALIKDLPPTRNFLKALPKGRLSLIAEIKKASPSVGILKERFEPMNIAKVYEENGASAISVLTDEKFFMGNLDHLKRAKESTTIPILRKDFIIDESQIYESRISGADAILLIAGILSKDELSAFIRLSHELDMDTLVEVHKEADVETALQTDAKIIGINNRDLQTFKVNLETTASLIDKYPDLKSRIIVSESGIEKRDDVELLLKKGVDAVLVGEAILKSKDIGAKIRELIPLL